MKVYSLTQLQKRPSQQTPRCSLEVKISSGILRLAKPQPDEYFKIDDQWPVSNEPEEHLDEIAERILNIFSPNSILCFSYKDNSLAERLYKMSSGCNISKLTGKDSLCNESPEHITASSLAPITTVKKTFDLILIRHFLEHTSDPSVLIENLSRMLNPGGYIYIEVPLIENFIENMNPLFLWEQHRVYFTNKSFLRFIESLYYETVVNKVYGSDIEPSSCTLIKKLESVPEESQRDELDPNREKLDSVIKEICSEFKDCWSKYLYSQAGKIAVFGIGHTAHRFIQITNAQDKIDYLIDGDINKKGFYLPGLPQEILHIANIDLSTIRTFILGVHARDYEKVAKILRDRGFNGEILSIYERPTIESKN